MANDIKISLKAEGANQVKAALESVKSATLNMERANTRAFVSQSQARQKELQKELHLNQSIGKASHSGRSSLRPGNSSNRHSAPRSSESFSSAFRGNIQKSLGDFGKLGSAAGRAGAAFAIVSKAIDIATEGLKAFGSFLVNDIVKPGFDLQTKSAQIANATGGEMSASEVERASRAIAVKYNGDPTDVAGGAADFADKTGNIKLGFEIAELSAQMAKAYGGDIKDYTSYAGNQYKEGMSATDLKQIMYNYVQQGFTDGSKYSPAEMARLGGQVNAISAGIGGNASQSSIFASAAIQQAGKTATSSSTAATAVDSFVQEITKDRKSNFGNYLNKEGRIASLPKLIQDMLVKTNGLKSNMADAGVTNENSLRFMDSFKSRYDELMKGMEDTEENRRKASEGATQELVNMAAAAGNAKRVEDAAAAVMATDGEKVKLAFGELKDQLSASLMPKVSELVTTFVENKDTIIGVFKALADAILWITDVVMAAANILGNIKDETGMSAGDLAKATGLLLTGNGVAAAALVASSSGNKEIRGALDATNTTYAEGSWQDIQNKRREMKDDWMQDSPVYRFDSNSYTIAKSDGTFTLGRNNVGDTDAAPGGGETVNYQGQVVTLEKGLTKEKFFENMKKQSESATTALTNLTNALNSGSRAVSDFKRIMPLEALSRLGVSFN